MTELGTIRLEIELELEDFGDCGLPLARRLMVSPDYSERYNGEDEQSRGRKTRRPRNKKPLWKRLLLKDRQKGRIQGW